MPDNNDYFPQVMQRYMIQPSSPDVNLDFITALLQAFEEKPIGEASFEPFSIELIVDYIQRTHVFYLQKKLPEIEQSILLLSGLYDSHHPILAILQNFFHKYCQELTAHIRGEEAQLLPYILLLQRADQQSFHFPEYILASRKYSISGFLEGHHDTEDELKDIRRTIGLYDPPGTNASLYRILLAQLETFEQDLRIHAFIEDKVLIPKALKIETALNEKLERMAPRN